MDKTLAALFGFIGGCIFVLFLVSLVSSTSQAADFETVGSDSLGTIYEGRYHSDAPMPCTPGDLHFGTFLKSVFKCETKWEMFSNTSAEDWRRYWTTKEGKE